jgi:multidrug efflux system membrane fusion protein
MTTVQPRKIEELPIDGVQTKPQLQPEHRDGGRPGESFGEARAAGFRAQPAKKRRWWVLLLLLLVAAGGGGYYIVEHTTLLQSSKDGGAAKAQRPIPVVTAKVERGDMPLYLSSLGTVTALQTDVVKTRVDGEVMEVFYTEGQMVKAGDPLVEIDPRPYVVQQSQAEGQLEKDKASLVQANQDLARYQQLIRTKAISQQTLDAQVATVGQFEGAIKTDQAAIDNAKLQIIYCHITAPIAGRIGLRPVDKGNLVQAAAGTTLATITQLQPITVIYTIPQDDIYRVQQKFKSGEDVLVEAWNRDLATRLASGKLTAIDNLVDTTTGTVKLRATYSNEDNLLFPNEFINAKTLIDVARNVLIVPASAVQRGPNGAFAYVVTAAKKEDGKNAKEDDKNKDVEMRTLQVGPTEGDKTVIEGGLNAGEIVVTEGTDRLLPGVTKVTIKGEGKKKKAKAKGQPANEKSNPGDSKAAQADATDEPTSETTGYRGDASQNSPGQASSKQQPNRTGHDPNKQKQPKLNGTKTAQ